MTMDCRVWLKGEGGYGPFLFGALGEHAGWGAGAFLRDSVFDDVPVRVDGPEAHLGEPCVVVLDAPLLARDASVAAMIPDNAGCLVVVPQEASGGEVEAARAALRNRAAWIALAYSPVEGCFGRGDRWDWLLHSADEAAPLIALAFAHPDFFSRFREHAGTLLDSFICWGKGGAGTIARRPLSELFAVSRSLDPAGPWRVVRTRWLFEIATRPTPAFLADLEHALDRLTPEQRADVDIRNGPGIRDDDPPETLWRLGVLHVIGE